MHHIYVTICWSLKPTTGQMAPFCCSGSGFDLSCMFWCRFRHSHSRSHTPIFVRTSAAEAVGLRPLLLLLLLRANIFIRPSSECGSKLSRGLLHLQKRHTNKAEVTATSSASIQARLSARPTLRTCPRDAQHRRPQVWPGGGGGGGRGCLFPHVKVISCDSQQPGGGSGMAVTGAHMCSETDNQWNCFKHETSL